METTPFDHKTQYRCVCVKIGHNSMIEILYRCDLDYYQAKKTRENKQLNLNFSGSVLMKIRRVVQAQSNEVFMKVNEM